LFSEKKEYVAKLEVIIDNHYFVPMTQKIKFIRPLSVIAEVLTHKANIKEELATVTATRVEQVTTVPVQAEPDSIEELPDLETKPIVPSPALKKTTQDMSFLFALAQTKAKEQRKPVVSSYRPTITRPVQRAKVSSKVQPPRRTTINRVPQKPEVLDRLTLEELLEDNIKDIFEED
jgi:translation initiation factor RLI1